MLLKPHVKYMTCGTITNTVDFLRTGQEGKHLSTIKINHIYFISKDILHMSETDIGESIPYSSTYHPPIIYNRPKPGDL
jgi:hypothetical protein